MAEELDNDSLSDVALGMRLRFLSVTQVLRERGFLFRIELVLGLGEIGLLSTLLSTLLSVIGGSGEVVLRGITALDVTSLLMSSLSSLFEELFLLLTFCFPELLSAKSSGISHASRPNSTEDLALLVEPHRPLSILSSTKLPKNLSGLLLVFGVVHVMRPSSMELFLELPKLSGVLLFDESNISIVLMLLVLLLFNGKITENVGKKYGNNYY